MWLPTLLKRSDLKVKIQHFRKQVREKDLWKNFYNIKVKTCPFVLWMRVILTSIFQEEKVDTKEELDAPQLQLVQKVQTCI